MQEFEKYPKLTEHIQEMANTGRVPREWTSFLYELNEALKISSKPVLADSGCDGCRYYNSCGIRIDYGNGGCDEKEI